MKKVTKKQIKTLIARRNEDVKTMEKYKSDIIYLEKKIIKAINDLWPDNGNLKNSFKPYFVRVNFGGLDD